MNLIHEKRFLTTPLACSGVAFFSLFESHILNES